MDFTKKNVIVTGASSGIGKAIAEGIAQRGGNVINIDIDDKKGSQVCNVLENEYGVKARCYYGDLGDHTSLAKLIYEVIEEFGQIHVLINNAGIVSTKSFEDLSLEEFKKILDIDLTSYFITSHIIYKHMKDNGGGRIVNLSSVAAKRGGGLLGTAAYATAKNGVIGLSKAIAKEGAKYNIACNAVCPSWTKTAMTSGLSHEKEELIRDSLLLRRPAEPKEIAAMVIFFASDDASFITGEVGCVDGGYSMDG